MSKTLKVQGTYEFDWTKQEIFITGGTGSLGKTLIKLLCEKYRPKGIRVYSRDELKQWECKQAFAEYDVPISFLIGNVNNLERLRIATRGVNILIHTAAMKQVPACEDNPMEAIETNIHGAQNLLTVALENGITKVLNVTTDKAVYPVNLYGATKMVAEKLFINGNVYSGGRMPYFSCCRYGNVIGSRGSVIPLFKKQLKEGKQLTITHKNMTRFWITLPEVAQFILNRIEDMKGGEIFVPKMPSMRIMDLADAIRRNHYIDVLPVIEEGVDFKVTGIRPGEKIHETLISEEEAEHMIDCEDYLVLNQDVFKPIYQSYSSDNNTDWLTVEQLKEMI